MESHYSIKLRVNEEIRRFVFSGCSFKELKEKCMKMANIAEGSNITLKYEDTEGDKVTISSDTELEYALSLSNQLLRLQITLDNPNPSTQQAPIPQAQPSISPAFDPHSNWRAHKDAHKLAKYEWKQQRRAMKGRGPHNPVVPSFNPSAEPFVPHGLHAPYPPYMPPHGYAPFPHYYPSMSAETLSEPFPQGKKVKDLDARFISHQSYPDDTEVHGGSRFEKTWRFRNNGLLKWPEGTLFMRVDRANELSAPDTTLVASIEPNQETDVTVPMNCPISPGRYQSYFKLCSPSGKKFGQRMRCQILSVSDNSISPERMDKVWEQLEAMGFVEKGQRPNSMSSLILKENCDIVRIVRELTKQK